MGKIKKLYVMPIKRSGYDKNTKPEIAWRSTYNIRRKYVTCVNTANYAEFPLL